MEYESGNTQYVYQYFVCILFECFGQSGRSTPEYLMYMALLDQNDMVNAKRYYHELWF